MGGHTQTKLCGPGNQRLYELCIKRGIPHKMTGKLILANGASQLRQLHSLFELTKKNNCEGARLLSHKQIKAEAPGLVADEAIFSPRSGVLDSLRLMGCLWRDFQIAGGVARWGIEVRSLDLDSSGARAELADGTEIECSIIINSAGSEALRLVNGELGTLQQAYAHGDYFSYGGEPPSRRLIYPLPENGGLGIHLTVDTTGRAKFGPDLTWSEHKEHKTSKDKIEVFHKEIIRYWPNCDITKLSPTYSGTRSKIRKNGKTLQDFLVLSEGSSAGLSIIHLLGIDSPGLTSCLSLADHVFQITH